MALAYKAVGWNRQKRIYDLSLAIGVGSYLAVFVGGGLALGTRATIETLLIRALGTGALLLLHVILSIGPLCRLSPGFLPLLYNRRHLGVVMFLLSLGHGAFATIQYHALGDLNPLVSLLAGNSRLASVSQFPFELLGIAALGILFLMAATSHDFWLANLTAPVWKSLHMLVYVAWALLVLHVASGVLQAEASPILSGLLAAGVIWIVGLHVIAGWRERPLDRETEPDDDGYVDACAAGHIPDARARIVTIAGERVAIFRDGPRIFALSNVCQHQNGPLGEGRIVDGCVTCPWHGYQYLPGTGASPAPFNERVPTFDVKLENGRVLVRGTPNPPGASSAVATLE